MIFNIVRGLLSGNGVDWKNAIIQLAVLAFVFVFCLPIHEFAHAWTANKLGDTTAKDAGRLTINPAAHIDPIGSVLILLLGFGFAKAVPVNPRNFKDTRKGMALTAVAGPTSNIVLAVIFLLIQQIVSLFASPTSVLFVTIIAFCQMAASINVQLAVFNMLPIPPLDGSRLLGLVLPRDLYAKMIAYERIISMVVMLLLFSGALSTVIIKLSTLVFSGLGWLVGLPFKLIG